VNTPNTLSQKYWITNGAVHAQVSWLGRVALGGRSEQKASARSRLYR